MTAGAGGGDRRDPVVAAASVATGVLVVACAAGVVWRPLRPVTAGVSLVLFVVGTGAFLTALWRAAQRSRTEEVSVGGMLLAGGVAPRPTVRRLYSLLAVQVVAAVAAASIRPYTVVAFAVLAPMAGLGLVVLWGARSATFPPRAPDPRRRPPRPV